MDCDTTGVEPDFSLVKFKKLVGGGQMTIVNRTVPLALQTLGYSEQQVEQIEAHLAEHGTIIGAPGLHDEHLPVFDVAVGERAISHMGHIKMMGAVQPFISRRDLEDREPAPGGDRRGHRRRLHPGLAARRQGAGDLPRRLQDRPGAAHRRAAGRGRRGSARRRRRRSSSRPSSKALAEAGPRRKRMPRERQSITHKFSIGGHEGYITAGMYEDGTVGEIFLTDIGKEGSTLRGMMNSFATAISIALQYGVPLETLVQQVQLHALRARGDHGQPRDPVRQVDARLHHALARLALPGRRRPGGARHPHARRCAPARPPRRRPSRCDRLRHRRPEQRPDDRPPSARAPATSAPPTARSQTRPRSSPPA